MIRNLPAVNDSYAATVVRPKLTPRALPGKLRLSDLNFLDPKNKRFHLPSVLYSAGLASGNSQPCMITTRDRNSTFVAIDSGGFQVISGRISAPHSVFRVQSLQFTERHGDIGFILDVPTQSIDLGVNGFKTLAACLDQTEENAKWALAHRSNSQLKLLNVLQGRDMKEADAWFKVMGQLRFDGYAFAGKVKKDMWLACTRLVQIIDAGERPQHLHWFGIGMPGFGLMLTGLKRALRKHVNADIEITFDSSTAFSVGGAFKKGVIGLDYSAQAVRFRHYDFPATPISTFDLSRPFPFRSPICGALTMGDLMPKTDAYGGAWDQAGVLLLQHHNVCAEVQAMIDANRLMDMGHELTGLIPWEIRHAVEGMDKIFAGTNTGQALKDYKKALQFYGASDKGVITSTGDNR